MDSSRSDIEVRAHNGAKNSPNVSLLSELELENASIFNHRRSIQIRRLFLDNTGGEGGRQQVMV